MSRRAIRIGIILVSKEPLALQSLRFSTDFKSLFEGGFEGAPLPGQNFAPDYPHVHICYFPVRSIAHCITQCSRLHICSSLHLFSRFCRARGCELAQPPIYQPVEVMIRTGIVSGSFGSTRFISRFSRALLIAAVCRSRFS